MGTSENRKAYEVVVRHTTKTVLTALAYTEEEAKAMAVSRAIGLDEGGMTNLVWWTERNGFVEAHIREEIK